MLKLLLLAVVFLATHVHAQVPFDFGNRNRSKEFVDLKLLHNDKEEASVVLNKKQKVSLLQRFTDEEAESLEDLFYNSIMTVKAKPSDKMVCDLGLIQNFIQGLENGGFGTSKKDVLSYLKLLRSTNAIDDILLKLSLDLSELQFDLLTSVVKEKHPSPILVKTKKLKANNDIEYLYREFSTWPDEEQTCAIGAWYRLVNDINSNKKHGPSKAEIRRLNAMAYRKNIIDLQTYDKLEVLRKSSILERKIFLSGYLNKIFWAKNIMQPKNRREYDIPVEKEDKFSSKKASVFKNISRREAFYHKYNDEQVVVLAKILQMASVRMGVDPDVEASIPVIAQELRYQNEEGEYVTIRDEYRVENARDQYDYARKRMRMDIYQTNSFEAFANVTITYEDVLMAALETGYITHEEVEIALQYDDLWNKEESKLWKALSVAMTIGGTAVFYLPPPYNVIGAIGVALINAKIIQKKNGENNDNPNALFD